MHPILLYLLKMLLCSGILFGYYRLALYNERFHQWNRFYLIAALLLSVVVPLMEIPLMAEKQSAGIIYIIETMPYTIVAKAAPIFTIEDALLGSAVLVSAFFFIKLIWGLYQTVYLAYQKGDVSANEDISVIITETPAAPYSFFRWLFWRNDLLPDTPHGKRVLEHELTHIRENHSADKVFMELLLVVFWCNPFFWMIRKELYIIHEFLADRKAITDHNGAAFAQMILQTINVHSPSPLINPFFSSQIKRRLHMITTSNKPQFSYLRRISALVAMIGVSITLMLTIEKGMAQKAPPPPPPPPPPPHAVISMPDSINSISVNTKNGKSIATIKLKNGKVRTMPVEEAIKKGYPVPPPPPPPPPPPDAPEKPSNSPYLYGEGFKNGEEPLIIYAGLQITKEQLNQIDTDNIASVDVLKKESAIEKYGEKAKYGAIIIIPKIEVSHKESNTNGKEKVVMGYQLKTDNVITVPHDKTKSDFPEDILILLDGNQIEKEDLQAIESTNIAHINVLKSEKAIAKYGQKGEKGAIEIFTDKSGFNKIFTKTEEMPKFPGGVEGWRTYLSKNLQYPQTAIDKGVQGEAHVSFIVDVFGNLSNFEIVKDPGAGLGAEALRLIHSGPKWEPAKQNDKIVNARVVQVITFRLE